MFKIRQVVMVILFLAQGIFEILKESSDFTQLQFNSKGSGDVAHLLAHYLMDNWQGISNLPEEERLEAIEGQVRHTLTRRMKRIGARWTPEGADRMGRLLTAKANDELSKYVRNTSSRLCDLLESEVVIEKQALHGKEDLEAWLRASMPALKGPFAGKPWIKYVLKEIGSIQWPA